MPDILSDFSSSIQSYGLTPPDRIVADGKIHRFRSGPEKAENGFYSLSIVPAHRGGDIGFGLIGCWKRGLSEKWSSLKPGEMSEVDRQAIRRAREEQKRAEAAEATAAVKRAREIWAAAGPVAADHPYLVRKGIEPIGIRQHKDALVVPAYRDGALVSLQFIGPDGVKRFLKGGAMEGGYGSVAGKGTARDRIVIAEGYATAVSLHKATGLVVAVCFSAGNAMPVAKAIRAKYPDAEIILASDNDRKTVIRGKPVNVGIEAARKAAAAVGGKVTWPSFGEVEDGSDFNDYASLHGLEAMAAEFEAGIGRGSGGGRDNEPPPALGRAPAVTPQHPGLPEENEPASAPPVPSSAPVPSPSNQPASINWRARLIEGREVAEGHPYPFERKSKLNAYLFLKHHELFAGILCYNEFTDAVMIVRRPPWNENGHFTPRHIRDDDFFMLAAWLERCKISAGKDTAADAAIRVAKENAINPPREYLSRLAWDGKPRLDTWLTYYLGADEQPPEYLALAGAKWLIGAVSRVFKPGCKFDNLLILEGAQGIGKSMALRHLATFNGQDFFLDSVGDIRSKDTLMAMQGKLIVEIGELASFKKAENEEIKAFIARQVDEYRPPYGRTIARRPRYFVFAGTTNELDDGYLTDDTGNRRYWPVKCRGIDPEALERDGPQLWAEAVVRYRAGERTWLTREEAAQAAVEQKSRFVEDAWLDRIAAILKGEYALKIDDVMNKLELKPRDINNMTRKRVKNSLKQLGWAETRRAGEGRLWRRPGFEEPKQGELLDDVLVG